MQRKPTNKTRGPNAAEKRFHAHLKECECTWCGCPGPSIVDHVKGATFKHIKILIGHWFCLPNCPECDKLKTIEGKKLGNSAKAWAHEIETYHKSLEVPGDVRAAIKDWGESWQG